MYKSNLSKLRCPNTGSELEFVSIQQEEGEEIIEGILKNTEGQEYRISNGLIDFTTESDLVGDAVFARNYYAQIAKTYDENVDITFTLYKEDELDIRNRMIDLTNIKEGDTLLEVSAGTGKDSELIAKRLGKTGQLFSLDISPHMLSYAKEKLKDSDTPAEFVCASAVSLPFATNQFDALYCFAGVGHFPDQASALKEMARVVKPGGKVVFCEKHVPVWLRNTEYGKILINNNPMFADEDPLKLIPVEARDLGIRWINGNVHYVVDYTVGEGEPTGNFDMELPGARGGSFNTRYFGKLEGVTPETKSLAIKAREKLGLSMYQWLDELVKKESQKILDQK